jgi:hypothetical protein
VYPNDITGVSVSRASDDASMRWFVTFNNFECSTSYPLLAVAATGNLTGASTTVDVVSNVTASLPLGGSFDVWFRGQTITVPYNVKASTLSSQLQPLAGAACVLFWHVVCCLRFAWLYSLFGWSVKGYC